MAEHQAPGAPEYEHITEDDMNQASRLETELEVAPTFTARHEIIDEPVYKAVNKMQTEAGAINRLADLGAEEFGLDRQTVANNQDLLDALSELDDAKAERDSFVADYRTEIAGLEKKIEFSEKFFRTKSEKVADKVKAITQASTEKE